MIKKMKDSILQKGKECYICHTRSNLHRHHVFYGTANRKKSEQDGCVVYLCIYHHTGSNYAAHLNHDIDLMLKRDMEKAWLETYNKTKEDFIKRYGKNYI